MSDDATFLADFSTWSENLLARLDSAIAALEKGEEGTDELASLKNELTALMAFSEESKLENVLALARLADEIVMKTIEKRYSLAAPIGGTLRHCFDYFQIIRDRVLNEGDRTLSVQDDTFLTWIKEDVTAHEVDPPVFSSVAESAVALAAVEEEPAEEVISPQETEVISVGPTEDENLDALVQMIDKTAAVDTERPIDALVIPADVSATCVAEPAPPANIVEAPAVVESPALVEATKEPVTKPAEAPASAKGTGAGVSDTVRVDVERLDHLMNLAGELVINKARFSQISDAMRAKMQDKRFRFIVDTFSDRLMRLEGAVGSKSEGTRELEVNQLTGLVKQLEESLVEVEASLVRMDEGRKELGSMNDAVYQLSRLAEGIQKSVMSTRMVPVGPLFARFRRVVRDMATATGKQILLDIKGEQTELDKRMIDELVDPLVHMVRNSVDHGLERPEDRVAKGKPAEGHVWLEAAYAGNSVVITIRDDGRGLNLDRIGQKAVERGLTTAEELAVMSTRQVANFIWHAGFSTADKVTDISGRGVGMDIVRRKIDDLGGQVELKTEPGEGTTFFIRLPLTLAIMQSLLAEVMGEIYAVPLENVSEIITVKASDVHDVGGNRVVNIRGDILELIELDEVFWWGDRTRSASASLSGEVIAVILRNGESKMALIVHRLLGEEDIVIKSLADNLGQIRGLSGASILGDGAVALILDVRAVFEMTQTRPRLASETREPAKV